MAISYKIYQDDVFLKEVTELTATITDLQPNTKYTFHVTEFDGVDESGKSNVVEFTTGTIAVESITLNATEQSIKKGETFQLTATITPEDATDKTITWTSSDEKVATVSNTGLITALLSGSATITASTSNGKTATCALTITPVIKVPTELTATNVTATSVTLGWKKGV
ncbi:Ig-like domain-containing protein [Vagococcus xieshaowenii]|uniref:Fibronectin type-III domain-containing protein n=1 Tax=Vagococcus xieshaowenii TaxID=2562451 RepID=A0AAJ5JMG3_9ENTE|nr:Ig-like domain-containing protein [Vagococcus xieshaowenii]QCA28263.1 hypothetical protein E4Z98_02635 [Vagococcus xieshaowenii]TFZ41918.1 hypothetical protein E4031_04815 [Vagococcus xieshaowenii]